MLGSGACLVIQHPLSLPRPVPVSQSGRKPDHALCASPRRRSKSRSSTLTATRSSACAPLGSARDGSSRGRGLELGRPTTLAGRSYGRRRSSEGRSGEGHAVRHGWLSMGTKLG